MPLMISRTIKLRILHILTPFMRAFFSVPFDKRYLRGRYFDDTDEGWRWAWRGFIWQRIHGFNRYVRWPASPQIRILNPENITFHPEDINNFQGHGSYYQAFAKITIGKGTYIGPNVGIITMNHDVSSPTVYQEAKEVSLGANCWIGMNSVILPGVILGDHTVVGAGAIVTKSFPQGHVVVAGNPAKTIRELKNGEEKGA